MPPNAQPPSSAAAREPIKIQFRPGVDRETTDYGNTGGWYDCNLARIRTGTWSSMGGWQRFTASPVLGTMRSLFPFSTLNGTRFYATGTNLKYYLIYGTTPLDITPIRLTTNPMANNPFATASGTKIITVTDTANGVVMNDFVTFSAATGPFGGIPASDINQEHQVIQVVDANTYKIAVATTASSSTSGGGAVAVAAYQINTGLDTTALGNGWGTGPWGYYGWGQGSSTFVQTDQLRLWSQDNYGEDLLFNARDGGVYYKQMSAGIPARAVNLTSLDTDADADIPIVARQILVSDNDRHVMAFATNPIGSVTQDRLLFRWSATESLIDWVPTTTNSAGSLRIEHGSEFVAAIETTTEILVFTDISLHSVRYVGAPFIFGQTMIATNIQLIGPNAAVSTGALTAWMGNGRFQWYNGVVTDMPCAIRTYVFSILNTAQAPKIVAGTNREFSEFIWLMPVNGSAENNFYVICNFEGSSKIDVRFGGALTWYYGFFNTMGRTSWLDSWFETTPLAGATDGYIYAHDLGATDQSVTPAAMLNSYVKSSVFELADGKDFMLISRTIPDVDFSGSTATNPSVNLTFEKRDYPGSPFVDGPADPVTRTVALPVEQYTTKIDKRFRARSVQFGITSTSTGTAWSLGVPRIYANPDGQR
jgi:hypothetical protein